MKPNSWLDESLSTSYNQSSVKRINCLLIHQQNEKSTQFIEEKHGKESLCLLQEWESLEIKYSDYRNHQRFTLRSISKDLITVSVRLKSTINSRRAKQIIHRTEKQLFQDRVRGVNGILWDNAHQQKWRNAQTA